MHRFGLLASCEAVKRKRTVPRDPNWSKNRPDHQVARMTEPTTRKSRVASSRRV